MKFPERRPLFFPYLLADFPDRARFVDVLQTTLHFADFIEIGVPFSDPVADGPTLQRASSEVFAHGFKIESFFRLLQQQERSMSCRIDDLRQSGVVLWPQPISDACRESQVQAVIVPDVSHDESAEWRSAAQDAGLVWIPFVSLQTGAQRLKKIATSAEGFVYLLSLTGITGSSIRNQALIIEKARQIRKHTKVPVALGFGIKIDRRHDSIPIEPGCLHRRFPHR